MNKVRKTLTGGVLAASMLGGGVLAAGLLTGTAGAQDTSGSTATTAPATAPAAPAAGQRQAPPDGAQRDPSKGGHVGSNGTVETVLTGDAAAKATAAAQASQPGATIERVENDADGGGVYEAHVVTADGRHVTVLMDANFAVTSTQQGPGPR